MLLSWFPCKIMYAVSHTLNLASPWLTVYPLEVMLSATCSPFIDNLGFGIGCRGSNQLVCHSQCYWSYYWVSSSLTCSISNTDMHRKTSQIDRRLLGVEEIMVKNRNIWGFFQGTFSHRSCFLCQSITFFAQVLFLSSVLVGFCVFMSFWKSQILQFSK